MTDQTRRIAGRRGLAWYGVVGGPLLGLLNQQVVYMLAIWACAGHGSVPLHLVSALCALGAALATWTSWSELRRIRHDPRAEPRRERPHGPYGDEDLAGLYEERVVGRVRFMAGLGVLSGTLSVLWIVAMWVAVGLLLPCPSPA